jgi:hypothetical protein
MTAPKPALDSSAPAAAAPPSASAPHSCSPARDARVEVKRSGDRITQIHVICKCGEVIEIDCEY